jgi:hypothetical protein
VRKAFELLRTSVVEELNVRLDYYETLAGFDWNWVTDINTHAVASVLACFPSNQFEKRDENNVLIAYEGDRQFLDELIRTAWDYAVSRRIASQPAPIPTVTSDQPTARKKLVAAYRAEFPSVKIQDICWAADQTYREWRRWFNGKAKDGLKPDRSFKHVLTSGKTPEEIKGKPRPTKYGV